VAWTFERAGLRDGYRVDAVATIVDAANLERLLAEEPDAVIQIERADVLLVSKLDLVAGDLADVARLVGPLNASAPLLPAPPADTPWDLLIDAVPGVRAPDASPASAHVHGRPWETWRFDTTRVVSDERLEEFLRTLPGGLYRVKGLVRTDAGWMQVDAVGGRYEVEPCASDVANDASTIVGVGRGFDRDGLDAAAAALLVLSPQPIVSTATRGCRSEVRSSSRMVDFRKARRLRWDRDARRDDRPRKARPNDVPLEAPHHSQRGPESCRADRHGRPGASPHLIRRPIGPRGPQHRPGRSRCNTLDHQP